MTLELREVLTGKRSITADMPISVLKQIPEADVITVTDVPPPEPEAAIEGVEATEPPMELPVAEDAPVADLLQRVTFWEPVTHTLDVKLDGRPLRIFHTLRGPIIGQVLTEDSLKVTLFSPAMIDPNIQIDRIHYLPIAFAGRIFTLYKSTSIGESVPEEAEASGYPMFIKRNADGDYKFRMRAAYHHIEGGFPDAGVVTVGPETVRQTQKGLMPTSSTKEPMMIDRAKRTEEMLRTQAAAAPEN